MLDFQKATEAIKHHERILILPSSPVDGDSIGSALAIYSLFQGMGKNATVVLTSEIPDIYRFLPNIDTVQKTAKLYSDFMITIDLKDSGFKDIKHEIVDNKVNIIVTPENGSYNSEQITFPEPKKYFDLIITVDCADLSQLGSFYNQNYMVFSDVPSINIDHHISNKNFGSLNLVSTQASSTTQIIFNWFKSMNVEIDEDIATLLLAGIITDTGSFQNANTTPESFDAAAELIDLGGRQQEIIRHIYKTKQLNSLKLWGKILSKIQVNETYRYLWSSATQADFQQTGTTSADKGDIIDELMSNAQEADVILLLEEKPDGSLHGSLRSTNENIDISPIAAKFEGGGHSMAAGFTIPNATVDTHQNQILQLIEQFQRSRLETPAQSVDSASELNSPSPIFQEPETGVVTPEQDQPVQSIDESVSQDLPEVESVQQDEQVVAQQPEVENNQVQEEGQSSYSEETNYENLPDIADSISDTEETLEQSEESTSDLSENYSEPTEEPLQDISLDYSPDLQSEDTEPESTLEPEVESNDVEPYEFTTNTEPLEDSAEVVSSENEVPQNSEDYVLDNLPSIEEIVEPEQDNNQTEDFNLADPSLEDFDPAGLQEELQSSQTPSDPETKETEIDKLTRDFVSKQDQEDQNPSIQSEEKTQS